MQRFINNPDLVVEDTVKGFVKAHSDIVRLADNPRVVVAKDAPHAGKVGVVTGGGSGHEPAFIGYTGRNMLDAVAVGELFSSPTAKSFHDAIREANGGKGVIVLYGNYAGDNMNVKMAIKLAAKDGIEVATVVANDDVCSAPISEREKRRGVAGEIFMWKVGGAKAATGASLEEVRVTAQKAIDNCRSIGVGLGPCTLPAVGHPNFQIEPGTMEVGIGHHGEPGVRVEALKTADAVAKDMCQIVLDDHNLPAGTEVAVLLSGLGATPLNELYILNDTVESEIVKRGLKIHKTYIGNYFTSLEMVGATLTVPIYSGGRTSAKVRQSKESLSEARIQVDVSRDQVRAAVASAWTQYTAAREGVDANRALVAAAQLALNGVIEERNVGQRTTLDVLNAQSDVLTAKINLVSSEHDVVVASYAILSAIGHLSTERLGLQVTKYRPEEHYKAVKDKWYGLRTPDGR